MGVPAEEGLSRQPRVVTAAKFIRFCVRSLVAPDVQPLDSGVTAVVMATTNIDLDIAVLGAKILN